MRNKIFCKIFIILLFCTLITYVFVKHKNTNQTSILDNSFCDSLTRKDGNVSKDYDKEVREIKISGSCYINIGNNTNLLFYFENTAEAKDKDPKFVLKIYDSNKSIVQVIQLDYSWSYNEETISLRDDINFDGYNDLLVKVFGPRASQFTYYTYDSLNKKFVIVDSLTRIFTPSFDSKSKTITTKPDVPSYYFDNNGDQQYYLPSEQNAVYRFIKGTYTRN